MSALVARWLFALGIIGLIVMSCEDPVEPPDTSPTGVVVGTGTLGQVAAWADTDSIGDAPIKITAEGDVVLPPGASLWIINATETDCIQITGDQIRTEPGNCPSYLS